MRAPTTLNVVRPRVNTRRRGVATFPQVVGHQRVGVAQVQPEGAELTRARCAGPGPANPDLCETFEWTHRLCFHLEFEHGPVDPDTARRVAAGRAHVRFGAGAPLVADLVAAPHCLACEC